MEEDIEKVLDLKGHTQICPDCQKIINSLSKRQFEFNWMVHRKTCKSNNTNEKEIKKMNIYHYCTLCGFKSIYKPKVDNCCKPLIKIKFPDNNIYIFTGSKHKDIAEQCEWASKKGGIVIDLQIVSNSSNQTIQDHNFNNTNEKEVST